MDLGGEALLDTPLEEVLEHVVDPFARDALGELAEISQPDTLADLLDDRRAARAARDRLGADARARIRDELLWWVEEWLEEDLDAEPGIELLDAGSAKPALQPRDEDAQGPPRKPDAVRRWARQHGIESWLGAPAFYASPWTPTLASLLQSERDEGTTIADCIDQRIPGIRPRSSTATELLEAARCLLGWARARHEAEQRRAQLWSEPPAHPALARLVRALHTTLERVGSTPAAQLPAFTGNERLRAREEPVAVELQLPLGPHRWAGSTGTRLELTPRDDGLLPTSCTCRESHRHSPPACEHLRVAIEWTLDALHDPSDPLHESIVELAGTPGWVRMARALGRELERYGGGNARESGGHGTSDEPERRLVWRVSEELDPHGLPVSLEAAQQRRRQGKAGGWTRGSVVSFRRLADEPPETLEPCDLAVLGAVLPQVLPGGFSREPVQAGPLLRALADHPRVVSRRDPSRPLAFEQHTPAIVLHPESGTASAQASGEAAGETAPTGGDGSEATSEHPGGGYRIAFRLGDEELPARALAAGMHDGALVNVDLDRARVTFALLTERARLALAALARHPPMLPDEGVETVLPLLLALQPEVRVELPEALLTERRTADERPVVRLTPEPASGGALEVELRVRPLPGGPSYAPGQGPPLLVDAREGRRVAAQRDPQRERERAHELAERLGLERDGGGPERIDDLDAAVDLVRRLQELPRDEAQLEWPEDARAWRVRGRASAGSLRVRVRRLEQWFGVDGDVEVDGEQVKLTALMDAVRAGRRYVRLGPGRFAAIERELRERLAGAQDVLVPHRKQLAVGAAAADRVRGLVDDEEAIDADRSWRRLLERMDAARTLEPEPPRALHAELRPYQRDGYRWLARLAAWEAGACLADEMGLGKTVQALAAMLDRASLGPQMVVAPTSVVPGWIAEAQRFAPSLRVVRYHGTGRAVRLQQVGAGDLIVTSYDILARDAAELAGVPLATLVLDEAQAVKNARTRRAKAVRQLAAEWRIALTGTPLENHLGELWSILSIVSPGLLGSWEHFRQRFAAPIERDGDRARRDELAKLLRPFVLRRTKRAVEPDLPPRTELLQRVELGAAERAKYEAERGRILESLASGLARQSAGSDANGSGSESGADRFEVLAAITRLRRLACDPRLVDREAPLRSSSKLDAFMELVRDTVLPEAHRALVFSQFTGLLALVRERLDAEGIGHLYLDGGTPMRERERLVAQWQQGEAPLFLISLKAGGTGLNLTAADYVIHLDPWWNPAVEDQASDRAHRIGQSRAVTVVRLVSEGTIEEAVLGMHAEKRELAAGVLEGGAAAARLSSEELISLVRDGGSPEDAPSADEGPAPVPLRSTAASQSTASAGEDAPGELDAAWRDANEPGAGTATPQALDAGAIAALAVGFRAHLEAEVERGTLNTPSTAHNYRRAVERFVAYAQHHDAAPDAPEQTLQQRVDAYLADVRSGSWPAPKSEPILARAALGRLLRFAATQPVPAPAD